MRQNAACVSDAVTDFLNSQIPLNATDVVSACVFHSPAIEEEAIGMVLHEIFRTVVMFVCSQRTSLTYDPSLC